MTPDKQQELLKRCLALQPLVGAPEGNTAWVDDHIYLCIWQDHLLGWLAARIGLGNMRVWYDKHEWAIATPECMTINGPSLIEALLGTCEHIQQLIKEQSDA